MGSFWHPFSDMAAVEQDGELVVARGDGAYVYDEQGKRYFDASGGLWYCNVGYGRGEIADAAAAQMRELCAYSNFGDLATRPTLDLAERVADLVPMADAKVFFTSGGSDSVDTAAKLALRYWSELGEQRDVLITRDHAYHGMHAGGTALAGIADNRAGYPGLFAAIERVPHDSAAELEATIERLGAGRVAAFFCEPVIGAGGVHAVSPEYLKAARDVCRRHGVLFVADEVICGFGRLGEWFASTRYDLDPDLLTCAKGLTSGYLPLGAVVAAGRVTEPFFAERGTMWRHGYTYSGHASAAAAALANLDILEREGLVPRVKELEQELVTALAPLTSHPLVSEVRAGTGFLGAVQLPDMGVANRVVAAMRERGVLTRALAGGSVQISPSFVTGVDDLKLLADTIQGALDAVD